MTPPLATIDAALSLLRERGVLTLVPAGDPPSIVEAVCGGPVRGSWWAHPNGHLIYAIATALDDARDVLTAKLLAGKITFVHRSLWPALIRFATDDDRRAAVVAAIRPAQLELLTKVERRGEVHFGGRAPPAASTKAALERRWLVISTSEHTTAGRHAAVLRSWQHWAPPRLLRAANSLSFETARATLTAVCGPLGEADPTGRGEVRDAPPIHR